MSTDPAELRRATLLRAIQIESRNVGVYREQAEFEEAHVRLLTDKLAERRHGADAARR